MPVISVAASLATASSRSDKRLPSFRAPGVSCSPTTERQIRHAVSAGFLGVALDPRLLITGAGESARALAEGLAALRAGRGVILHTALGPDADVGASFADGSEVRAGAWPAAARPRRAGRTEPGRDRRG